MTKREAVKRFKIEILPEVRKRYEADGIVDKPARAEVWNDWTDALCKEGQITTRQYETWGHPR